MRVNTIKRLLKPQHALWACAAVLIISGLFAGKSYVDQVTKERNDAVQAAESAENERDEAKADADAARQREADERAERERLERELQAKRETQARIAAAQAKPPSTSPATGDQNTIGVLNTIPTQTSGVGCSLYEGLLGQYDWNVSTMLRIMNAETGCDPNNHNYGDNHGSCLGSYGLLQIGCVHGIAPSVLADPAANINAAYNIWKSQGYGAWSTY